LFFSPLLSEPRLERFGQELLRKPGMYRTGQAVLEEALAFYQEVLPEEGNDPSTLRGVVQRGP
jgi:hypothetical protein